jgi:hypothetical protein
MLEGESLVAMAPQLMILAVVRRNHTSFAGELQPRDAHERAPGSSGWLTGGSAEKFGIADKPDASPLGHQL